ncbi:MAG: hypothetical protein ACRBDI_09215 [Alphaproteobacteria bacterium]
MNTRFLFLCFSVFFVFSSAPVNAADFKKKAYDACKTNPHGTDKLCGCLMAYVDEYLETYGFFTSPGKDKNERNMRNAIESIVADDPAMDEGKIIKFCDIGDEEISKGGKNKGVVMQGAHNNMGANARTKRVLTFDYGVCMWRREVRAAEQEIAAKLAGGVEFQGMGLVRFAKRKGCRVN